MKYPILATLGLATLLLPGCSTPTTVDKGAIHAATFSFVARNPGTEPAFADGREQVHAAIHAAITRTLAAKGLTQVASGGDVTVAYLVIVGNNGTTESINAYFGYGRDTAGLEDKAQSAYSNSKNPNAFQAGTLLVDIIDSKTYKLLKRSYVVRPLLSNPTAQVRAERIQEAVNEALKDVRIQR
jgi:hypothetical protein